MIVLFEGPELAGKTTIVRKVEEILEGWGLPVQRYDTIQSKEEEAVSDLTNVFNEILSDDSQIWLVDTFHFYPWVYAKAKKSVSYGGSDWMLFEAGLKKLDEDLAEKGSLFMFITTPPWTIDQRATKTGRRDPTGDGQKAQYWWLNSIHKTDCEMIHFVNDKTKFLLYVLSFLFSLPILKHHSSFIDNDIDFSAELLEALQPYLEQIGFDQDLDTLHQYFDDFNKDLQEFTHDVFSESSYFSIFVLVKLCYSLLTAADYCATSNFAMDLEIKDFGILTHNYSPIKNHPEKRDLMLTLQGSYLSPR